MITPENTPILTVEQAAKVLGISRPTLSKAMIDDEEFPGRKFGNKWIINHQLLLLWAARVEKKLWPDHLKGVC